ncbi:MAG: Rieske 2Fe-2S domain-containing protein [Bauldia sp.]
MASAIADRLPFPREATFHPADWAVLSRSWFPVARSDEVLEKPIRARLLDTDVVVYRTNGAARVARDLCFHRGTALSLGWVEGEAIVCPYHGFQYGPDGTCLKVPAHPDMAIPPKLRITTFPAAERYGLIWTTLNGPSEPLLPEFPAWEDPDYQAIMAPTIDIAGSAGRQVEGFLDVAHFAWAHNSSFAVRENQIVPTYKVERTARGIRSQYVSSVSNYPVGLHHLAPPDFQWLRDFEVFPPFAARLIVHFPNGGRLNILNAASPIAARKTRLFVPIAKNFDKHIPVEDVHAFNLTIFNEDRVMVESQRPEDLPLDITMEAHIAADRTSIAYRKLLKESGLGALYFS